MRCARSVAFVSALERGARSPSLETLDDLARSLDVPLAELFRLAPQVAYEDPYFGKLVSFAQTARLGRRDVDRMIAVACALFGVARESVPSAPAQPTAKPVAVCAVRGCGRPPVAKGLCPSHYHRHRRLDAARA